MFIPLAVLLFSKVDVISSVFLRFCSVTVEDFTSPNRPYAFIRPPGMIAVDMDTVKNTMANRNKSLLL